VSIGVGLRERRHIVTQRTETRKSESAEGRSGIWWNSTGWVLGILGGISAFLGLFVMFGPEDEFVGIGGDLSWSVGEISTAWMYSLLIAGLVMLAAGLAMIVSGGRRAERVGGRASERAELLWHFGIFILVNGFIWIQDLAIGGGVDYAYWVTIPWAIALAVHTSMYTWNRRHESLPAAGRPGDPQPH
jgi:hypothetical protein